jgi:hypothetical protein
MNLVTLTKEFLTERIKRFMRSRRRRQLPPELSKKEKMLLAILPKVFRTVKAVKKMLFLISAVFEVLQE